MHSKITLARVGVGDTSLRIWQEITYRVNRIHLPLVGRALCRDINGEKLLQEGSAYLLVNSMSQNFSLVPGYRYYHFYVDFQTAPPLVTRELVELSLNTDPVTAHILSAMQDLLYAMLPNGTDGVITAADGAEEFWQVERLLDVLLRHICTRYGVTTVENPKIESALEYIEQHYTEPLGNADIAEALCIDTRYLIRLFQKYMNMPPYQYLTQCRIEHAMGHLRNGKNVSETAYLCGYQSENAFRIAFKRVMGCPPTSILKNNLGDAARNVKN